MRILHPLPLLALAGCMVGPDYVRPELDVPAQFRGDEQPAAAETSLGDLAWFQLFRDEVLVELIARAVANNWDARIAAERVLEASAAYDIEFGALLPELSVGGRASTVGRSRNGIPSLPSSIDRTDPLFDLGAFLSWELDFWGKLRRGNEAAWAELMATEANRRFVLQSLVADVAFSYFALRELDLELEISRRTLVSREASLQLVQARFEGGVANEVEVRQAQVLVITARQRIPLLEQGVEVTENALSILLGENPGPVTRGLSLESQDLTIEVPAGLPAALLERRPDVVAAEQGLVAANARIGQAQALLFPSITLTGSGGVSSTDLDNLFETNSTFWDLGVSLLQPLFSGGRLLANVRAAESRKMQAVLRYGQTVQNAFREVADGLIGVRKSREYRAEKEQLAATLAAQRELSNARYNGGVTSYLEVLDTERQYFDAELELARARADELNAVVALYRALGGGWQGTPADPATLEGPQQ